VRTNLISFALTEVSSALMKLIIFGLWIMRFPPRNLRKGTKANFILIVLLIINSFAIGIIYPDFYYRDFNQDYIDHNRSKKSRSDPGEEKSLI